MLNDIIYDDWPLHLFSCYSMLAYYIFYCAFAFMPICQPKKEARQKKNTEILLLFLSPSHIAYALRIFQWTGANECILHLNVFRGKIDCAYTANLVNSVCLSFTFVCLHQANTKKKSWNNTIFSIFIMDISSDHIVVVGYFSISTYANIYAMQYKTSQFQCGMNDLMLICHFVSQTLHMHGGLPWDWCSQTEWKADVRNSRTAFVVHILYIQNENARWKNKIEDKTNFGFSSKHTCTSANQHKMHEDSFYNFFPVCIRQSLSMLISGEW